MMPLTAVPTAGIGLMLIGLAHAAGWPVVAGGSARITDAMAAALVANGGRIETGPLGALAGRTPRRPGDPPRRLAARASAAGRGQTAPAVPGRAEPVPLRSRRLQGGLRPCPGRSRGPAQPAAGPAPCNLGGPFEQVAAAEADVAAGKHPERPYVLVVQPGVADPSRAPVGQQTLWTYCHVPAGSEVDMTGPDRGAGSSGFAPGFRDLVLARSVRNRRRRGGAQPRTTSAATSASACLDAAADRTAPRCPGWNPYRTPARGVLPVLLGHPARSPGCTAGAANWPR